MLFRSRFTLDEGNYVKALRLFKVRTVWRRCVGSRNGPAADLVPSSPLLRAVHPISPQLSHPPPNVQRLVATSVELLPPRSQDEPKWVPYDRSAETDVNPFRQEYVQTTLKE